MNAQEEGEIAVLGLSGVNYHFNGHTPGAFNRLCPFSPLNKNLRLTAYKYAWEVRKRLVSKSKRARRLWKGLTKCWKLYVTLAFNFYFWEPFYFNLSLYSRQSSPIIPSLIYFSGKINLHNLSSLQLMLRLGLWSCWNFSILVNAALGLEWHSMKLLILNE